MARRKEGPRNAQIGFYPREKLNAPAELLSPQPKLQRKATGSSSSKKSNFSITRRSERIRHLPAPSRNQDTEVVGEEIIVCDSEKEEEEEVPYVEEHPSEDLGDEELPFETMDENASLEEKVAYLFRTVKESMSQASKKHPQNDSQSADLNYRSLYFESQKKIEALTEENRELSDKLKDALAKKEVYGEAITAFSEVLAMLKDTILVSSLAKVNEAAMNLSSLAMLHRCSSAPGDVSEPAVAEGEASESRKRKKSAK